MGTACLDRPAIARAADVDDRDDEPGVAHDLGDLEFPSLERLHARGHRLEDGRGAAVLAGQPVVSRHVPDDVARRELEPVAIVVRGTCGIEPPDGRDVLGDTQRSPSFRVVGAPASG